MNGLAPSPAVDPLPVSLFGSVMGLAALSTDWRAASALGLPAWPADIFGVLAVLGFAGLTAAYLAKAKRRRVAVEAEFEHPLTRNFFGMPLICLLLLPPVIEPVSRPLAALSWSVGVGGMAIFACIQLGRWLAEPRQRDGVTPAWLIMAVGILDIPLAMPALGLLATSGFGVACVVIGLSVAAALYVYAIRRYAFGPPLPAAQTPTLLIAVAPLAVGCSSYATVAGETNEFARALLVLAVATLAALFMPVGRYLARTPFALSWWGMGFPIAATAAAALHMSSDGRGPLGDALAIGLLTLATLAISGLLLSTAIGVASGRLWPRPA